MRIKIKIVIELVRFVCINNVIRFVQINFQLIQLTSFPPPACEDGGFGP